MTCGSDHRGENKVLKQLFFIAEEFKIKKSSHSRKVAKQLKRELQREKEEKEREEKEKQERAKAQASASASASEYSAENLQVYFLDSYNDLFFKMKHLKYIVY